MPITMPVSLNNQCMNKLVPHSRINILYKHVVRHMTLWYYWQSAKITCGSCMEVFAAGRFATRMAKCCILLQWQPTTKAWCFWCYEWGVYGDAWHQDCAASTNRCGKSSGSTGVHGRNKVLAELHTNCKWHPLGRGPPESKDVQQYDTFNRI